MGEAISSKVTLVVEGVARRDQEKEACGSCDVTLIVDKHAPVSSVWDMLKDQGYHLPIRLDRGTEYWTKHSEKKVFHPHTELQIVDDKSAVDDTHVYINDPLVAHSNRLREVTFDIGDEIASQDEATSALTYDAQANTLVIEEELSITFHRTVRMPDDDRLHSLPASVGVFPLYNVADYAPRLPEKISEKGGLFLPMWQREALWINFHSIRSEAYAVRVYLGQINAVTGKSMMEKDSDENESPSAEQDYVVVPGQNWIDGVCVAPGVVRQFVAMPLGSGYTIEGQKTGEEKHGGIQLEIIPSFKRDQRKWLREELQEVLNDPYAFLDELKTPEELGFKMGDKLLSYPPEAIYSRPTVVADLLPRDSSGNDMDIISLKAFNLPKPKLGSWELATKGSGRRSDFKSKSASTMPPPLSILSENPWSIAQGSAIGDYIEITSSATTTKEYSTEPSNAQSSAGQYTAEGSAAQYHQLCGNSFMLDEGIKSDSPGYPLPTYQDRDNDYCLDDIPLCAEGHTSSFQSPPLMPTPPPAPVPVPVPSLNIKAMGLAAGGKLIQDIVSDDYPDRTWDIAAARMINIHILDPVSCEQVTHIVPKPVPMSAYKAIEAELPFFVVEEQIDNRVEGGDFENVKSVAQMDEAKGVSGDSSDPDVAKMCQSCEKRLCDCVIRPCNHKFCNVCIHALEKDMESTAASQVECPQCKSKIVHVAGFAAPMNLPGEESIRTKMPVHVLKVEDGRMQFQSIRKMRI